ncbi:hypothetical protein [Cryobacterium sp. Y11]|uniref:hypothetical protein n=1 Tax=Cryobacterium sp. Y11 TaxID=2045016 RepID=UPI000CE41E97|nr:hypothetical protein [Cryobacterium sp. Y11]
MTIDSPQNHPQAAGLLERGPVPNTPNPPQRRGGIVLAALTVGIGAFVTGWIPILGLLLGIAGILLGILAIRTPGGKSFGLAGLIGSSLAVLTNMLVTMVIVVGLVSSGIGTAILAKGQPVVTPLILLHWARRLHQFSGEHAKLHHGAGTAGRTRR